MSWVSDLPQSGGAVRDASPDPEYMRTGSRYQMTTPRPIFTASDQAHAYAIAGANCGPGALACMSGRTPLQIATMLGDRFRKLGGTTEIMIETALVALDMPWTLTTGALPDHGIVRIFWEGPWTDFYDRCRHSHWIGATLTRNGHYIFDINAMSVGGWLPLKEWTDVLVPWLLERCEPQASGRWTIGEAYEIALPSCRQIQDLRAERMN